MRAAAIPSRLFNQRDMERDRDVDGLPRSEQGSTPVTMEAEAQSERRLSLAESSQQSFRDYDEFYDAISSGDTHAVETMLDAGAYIDREADDGATPLLIAIDQLHTTIVQLLLERGADVNSPVIGSPPLIHAVGTSELAPRFIQLLLDHGADIEATAGRDSMTALHVAAVSGELHAADFLIDKGLDIHRTCEGRKTALHLAAEKGHTTVIKLLVAKGADLHARTENGATALMWAANGGHVETVQYLLEKGLSLEDRDEHGLTALSVASRAGCEEVVELLIEKGADLNALSHTPRKATPAMWAAISGHANVLKTLISHDADLSIVSDNDLTIIEATLRRGRRNTAKILLEAIGGPDYPSDSVALQIATTRCRAESRPLINTISLMFPHLDIECAPPGKWGWIGWVLDQGGELVRPRATLNLLHFALLEEEADMVAELLRLGVDPNINVFNGDTPLHAAVGCHNRDILQLLLDSGADPARPSKDPEFSSITPLHYAVIKLQNDPENDTSIVDILLTTERCKLMKGKDLDSTVFAYLLRRFGGRKDGLAKKLLFRMLESTPDIDNDRSDDGCTMMHTAALFRNTELVELLQQKGADINAKDKYGFTPFLVAARSTPEFLDFLVSKGADPFAVDIHGRSALHIAAARGRCAELEHLLTRYKLDVKATDNRGRTALIVAFETCHGDAAMALLEAAGDFSSSQNQTAIHHAALRGMYAVIDWIFGHTYKCSGRSYASTVINSQNDKGWTPLALACMATSPAVVPKLLFYGALINTTNPLTGNTPLHIALQRPLRMGRRDQRDGDPAMLLLLHPDIDITIRDAQQRTPLHLAALYHNFPATQLLLSKGADPNAIDASGKTPLSLCSRPDTALALLEAGADVNHAEPNGWTPVHHAVHRCWVRAYAVLEQHGADIEARTQDDGLSARERMEKMGGRERWVQREVEFIMQDFEIEERRVKMLMDELY